MNNHYDNPDFANDWKQFVATRKWIVRVILSALVLFLVCFFTCNTANGQERAKTVSVEKMKRFGTKYLVCVETSSGKRYSLKWNAHTYYSKNVEIPERWTVMTKRRKSFIEPIK